ncbi:MAG TPA: AAA family ATPase, partial [Leptospiraceae bacterium]|nr:AAA family ATPase [Leptospiraceae bacterium]
MYIKEIKIQNIRSIENFEMKFEDGEEAGWHVLLGDNGTGKTTILQSIGIGFLEQVYLINPNFQFKSSSDGST